MKCDLVAKRAQTVHYLAEQSLFRPASCIGSFLYFGRGTVSFGCGT
ncbi:unnamed protein product, partial [marine sediment metagenome]